jgi:hypothetical protein
MRLLLSLLPSVLLPVGTAVALTMASMAPDAATQLLAIFADDQAAIMGAVTANATVIGFAGPGAIAVVAGAGLPDRLRRAGAIRVTNLHAALGCLSPSTRLRQSPAAST